LFSRACSALGRSNSQKHKQLTRLANNDEVHHQLLPPVPKNSSARRVHAQMHKHAQQTKSSPDLSTQHKQPQQTKQCSKEADEEARQAEMRAIDYHHTEGGEPSASDNDDDSSSEVIKKQPVSQSSSVCKNVNRIGDEKQRLVTSYEKRQTASLNTDDKPVACLCLYPVVKACAQLRSRIFRCFVKR
jgi:hypothetical protein